MKKELFALLVLVLIFAASLINIHCLNRLSGEIAALIEQSDGYIRREDWKNAQIAAAKAHEKWESRGAYIHMVIRHSEIESVANTLSALIKEIYSEEKGAARGAARAAAERMASISSVERLRLRNIF